MNLRQPARVVAAVDDSLQLRGGQAFAPEDAGKAVAASDFFGVPA